MGIVQTLIQKSTEVVLRILSISFFFLEMSNASDNTTAVMKKQLQRVHSVFSNVGTDLLVFFTTLVKI